MWEIDENSYEVYNELQLQCVNIPIHRVVIFKEGKNIVTQVTLTSDVKEHVWSKALAHIKAFNAELFPN